MPDYLSRSKELLGEDKITSFNDKVIMVVGLGGVGGTAFNALLRSGFKHFIIVDFDVVDPTNLNRQIMYTSKDIGKNKVDVCEAFAKDFSKDIIIEKHNMFVDENSLSEFKDKKIDYIVDAIDKIPSKLSLIKFANDRKIPIIVSLGMGNRINPEDVMITKLHKTENDPLAKRLRYLLRKESVDLKSINVVFSKETPIVKKEKPASMIMVPSTAGLLIAKHIIESI
ncbi:MAG: ThiF family adenylyltransferase [Bacilli bacterium]|nr:ThiF family adenylyltransferase [Bacilli bacterium]